MSRKELYKAYTALAVVSFFWGTTYVAIKVGTQHMPGLFVAGVRQFLSGIILVSYFLLRGYKLPAWKDLRIISIQGFFLLCLANGMLTWAMDYISGGLAAIIAAMVPLFVALFSIWLARSARITKWMLIGLLVGFGGVFMIFYDYLGNLMQDRLFFLGIGMAILSVMSWSFGTVYSSREKPKVDILFNVGLQMFIAGVVMLIVCGFTGKYVNLSHAGAEPWLAILYLVVFGSLLAYTAYVFAISKLPATQVSIYAYINPVVAVFLGWLILSERMNLTMIVGTVITLLGIYLVNREFKRSRAQN